ncbi:lonely Cys domain-containing protein [Streptomyces milbemycinicus]|uniref:lonely Cys domain-containing protein n=1 Tax=Streptomyces milbemycinicus TaxID=476552 RepID=UPI001B8055C8|nr:lonely Cys domain-containing protein [Streptomyces milbemycinicus]
MGGPLPGESYGSAQSYEKEDDPRRERLDAALRRIGANRNAWAPVGSGYVIQSIGAADEQGRPALDRNYAKPPGAEGVTFGYHFAQVVMASEDGAYQVTLENHARKGYMRSLLSGMVEENRARTTPEGLRRLEAGLRRRADEAQTDGTSAQELANLRAYLQLTEALLAIGQAEADARTHPEGSPEHAAAVDRMGRAHTRAQTAIRRAAPLIRNEDQWYFRVFSKRQGETIHEVNADLLSDGPSAEANPLTAVVVHGHRITPKTVAFAEGEHEVTAEQKKTVIRGMAATVARVGLWNLAHGLPLPDITVTGRANNRRFSLGSGAKNTGQIRAENIAKALRESLAEHLERLQSGLEAPLLTADRFRITEMPETARGGGDPDKGREATITVDDHRGSASPATRTGRPRRQSTAGDYTNAPDRDVHRSDQAPAPASSAAPTTAALRDALPPVLPPRSHVSFADRSSALDTQQGARVDELGRQLAEVALRDARAGLAPPKVKVTGHRDGTGSARPDAGQGSGTLDQERADTVADALFDSAHTYLRRAQRNEPSSARRIDARDIPIEAVGQGRTHGTDRRPRARTTVEIVRSRYSGAVERLDTLRRTDSDPALREGPFDPDPLVRRILHLAPDAPVSGEQRRELYRLVDEAIAAERAGSLAELGVQHLVKRGVFAKAGTITSTGGRTMGRNLTGRPIGAFDRRSYSVQNPDGSLGEPITGEWWRRPGARSPYVVVAEGGHDHIMVSLPGSAPVRVTLEEFAALLATDPELLGLDPDVPVLLAVPGAGDRGLLLPRTGAFRTDRTVWAHSGEVTVRSGRIVVIDRGKGGPPVGGWIGSEPDDLDEEDIAAGEGFVRTTDGHLIPDSAVKHTTMVADGRPYGRASFNDADTRIREGTFEILPDTDEYVVLDPVTRQPVGPPEKVPWAGRNAHFVSTHAMPNRFKLTDDRDRSWSVDGDEMGGFLERRPSIRRLRPEDVVVTMSCWIDARADGYPEVGNLSRDTAAADPLETVSAMQRVANRTRHTHFSADRTSGFRAFRGQHSIITDPQLRPRRWLETRPEPYGAELDELARIAGLHQGEGRAPSEVRKVTLRLVRALRITFGVTVENDKDDPAGEYRRLLRGIGAVERMRRVEPGLRGADGRFRMELLKRAALGHAGVPPRAGGRPVEPTPEQVKALLLAAPSAPRGTELSEFVSMPSVEGGVDLLRRVVRGDRLSLNERAAEVLHLDSPDQVTDVDRERLLWAVIEAHEVLSDTPDVQALAAKVLHLGDAAGPLDRARHAELVWLITAASAAGRDVHNPTALAAYHLQLNDALSDDTLIRTPGSEARGRDWTGQRSTKPLEVAYYLESPDGTLEGAFEARTPRYTPWNIDGTSDVPRARLPFFVLADGGDGHIDMPWPDGSRRRVPHDEIAELLVHDPWLTVRPPDAEVAVIKSHAGSGSRSLPKSLNSRAATARTTVSSRGPVTVHDDPLTGTRVMVVTAAPGQKHHWQRGRPPAPAPGAARTATTLETDTFNADDPSRDRREEPVSRGDARARGGLPRAEGSRAARSRPPVLDARIIAAAEQGPPRALRRVRGRIGGETRPATSQEPRRPGPPDPRRPGPLVTNDYEVIDTSGDGVLFRRPDNPVLSVAYPLGRSASRRAALYLPSQDYTETPTGERPTLRFSGDRTLAVQCGDNGEQSFNQQAYATRKAIERANTQMAEAGNHVRLKAQEDVAIVLPAADGTRGEPLFKVEPEFLTRSGRSEEEICRDFAQMLAGGVSVSHMVFTDPDGGELVTVPINASDGWEVTGTHHLARALAEVADGLEDLERVDPRWAAARTREDDRPMGGVDGPLPGESYGSAQSLEEPDNPRRERLDAAVERIGANRGAWASVGSGYVIQSIGAVDEQGRPVLNRNFAKPQAGEGVPFGYHFAQVVLASEDGADQITLENHSRKLYMKSLLSWMVEENQDRSTAEDWWRLETGLRRRIEEAERDGASAGELERLRGYLKVAEALLAVDRATADRDEQVRGTPEHAAAQGELDRALGRAQAAIKRAASLVRSEDMWYFRMFSGRQGESMHEVNGDLLSDGPSAEVNPLTAVVVHGHRITPKTLTVENTRQLTADQNRFIINDLAATLARVGLWNHAHGLPLPDITITARDNVRDSKAGGRAKDSGPWRAEAVATALRERLAEHLDRLQSGQGRPRVTADQFPITPVSRTARPGRDIARTHQVGITADDHRGSAPMTAAVRVRGGTRDTGVEPVAQGWPVGHELTVGEPRYGGGVREVPPPDVPEGKGKPAEGWRKFERPSPNRSTPWGYEVSDTGNIRLPDGEVVPSDGWQRFGDDFVHPSAGVLLRGDSGWIGRVANIDALGDALELLDPKTAPYRVVVDASGIHLTPVVPAMEDAKAVQLPWEAPADDVDGDGQRDVTADAMSEETIPPLDQSRTVPVKVLEELGVELSTAQRAQAALLVDKLPLADVELTAAQCLLLLTMDPSYAADGPSGEDA